VDDAKLESVDNKQFKDIAYLHSQREIMVTDCAKYSAPPIKKSRLLGTFIVYFQIELFFNSFTF